MGISLEQKALLDKYKEMKIAQQIKELDRMLNELGINNNRDASNYEKFVALFHSSLSRTKISSMDWFIKNSNTIFYRQSEAKEAFKKEIEEFIQKLTISEQEELINNTKSCFGDVIGYTSLDVQDRNFERMRNSGDIYHVGKLNTTIRGKYKTEILDSIKKQTIECQNLIYQLWDVMTSQERIDNYGYLIQNSYGQEVKKTWEDLDSKAQTKYFPMILSKNYIVTDMLDIWASTKPETQIENLMVFIETIKNSCKKDIGGEDYFYNFILPQLWEKTSDEAQNSLIGKKYIDGLPIDTQMYKDLRMRLYKVSNSRLQSHMLAQDIKRDIKIEDKDNISVLTSELRDAKDKVYEMNFGYLLAELKDSRFYVKQFFDHCPDYIKEAESAIVSNYFFSILGEFLNEKDRHPLTDTLINSATYLNANSCRYLIEQITYKGLAMMSVEEGFEHNTYTTLIAKYWSSMEFEKQKRTYADLIHDLHGYNLQNLLYNHMHFDNVRDAKIYLDFGLGNPFTNENKKILDKFEKIYQLNNGVTQTINFDFLKSELFDSFSDEQLIRITHYPEVQEELVKYKGNKNFIKAFANLLNCQENWTLAADKIFKQLNNNQYNDLLKDLEKTELSSKLYDTINIALSKPNYFGLNCKEDIETYFDNDGKRMKVLLSIMRGETSEIPDIIKNHKKNRVLSRNVFEIDYESFEELSPEELKRFAIAEFLFGMDLNELDAFETRFKGVLDLNVENSEYIKHLLIKVQELNHADAHQMDLMIKGILEGKIMPTEYLKDLHLDSKAINLFTKEFQQGVYHPNEHASDLVEPVSYNGKNLPVYRLHGDFNMLVRVEGAYNSQFGPVENYKDFYENPSIFAHGNCESIIGQDQMGLARNTLGNIVVGYSMLPANSVLSSAPYDLGTRNTSLAPLYDKLYCEIRFNSLQKTIDNTRHTHNETVMERLIVDERGDVKKLKPSYLVWIEERHTDKFPPEFGDPPEGDEDALKEYNAKVHLWEETQKAAEQLQIPIVIINREECAELEMAKVLEMKKMLKGEAKLPEGKTVIDIAKDLITKFENNAVGVEYASNEINSRYFTNGQREEMYSTIIKALDNDPNITQEEKRDYQAQVLTILKHELTKFEEGCVKSDQGKTIKAFYESKVESLEKKISNNIEDNQENTLEQETKKEEKTTSFEEKVGIDNVETSEDAISNHVSSKMKKYSSIEEQIPLSAVLEDAKEIMPLLDKAQEVQSQNHSKSKVHGVQHVKNVLLLSNYIGKTNGLSKNDLDLIREAAIYHDIKHKFTGRNGKDHAQNGAAWYMENVNSTLNKKEVAFLISTHETKEYKAIENALSRNLPDITEQRKLELIKCAMILQDADRLDMLRYDIENVDGQRFNAERLNDPKNTSLISAVIELNTRQALKTGYLQASDNRISDNEETTERRTFDKTTLDNELMGIASQTTKTGYDGVIKNIGRIQKLSEPSLVAENKNGNPEHPDDGHGPNQ